MNFKNQSEAVINQIIIFLGQIDHKIMVQPLSLFGQSNIGQHLRHIHGFFDCLIMGNKRDCINYDKRNRDPRIETDPAYCAAIFTSMLKEIELLDLKQEIWVNAGLKTEDRCVDHSLKSSIGRELVYAVEHSIHHLAIIKMGMRAEFPHISIDEDLGIAPSTLEYRKTCVQ